jgi:hypothetical protein
MTNYFDNCQIFKEFNFFQEKTTEVVKSQTEREANNETK